jgi:uncharacterized membrane protein
MFGNFHPVIVHLPIGFLLLAILFQWIGRRPSYAHLRLSVPVILVLGMISALLACVTGLAISGSADYPEELLGWHQWMGIGTTLLSLGMFWAVQRKEAKMTNLFSVLLLAGVTVTGHLGGSLTHGEDFLSFEKEVAKPTLGPIADIQSAHAYYDLVQPIFEARCVSCHGSGKQKGKLRLDQPDYILKGGEDGVIVKAGDADNSELIKRLLLPGDAKKHMPPIREAQLTDTEISFLHWWIQSGLGFKQLVKDLHQTEADKAVLLALQEQSHQTGDDAETAGKGKSSESGKLNAAGKSAASGAGVKPVFTLAASIPSEAVKAADPALVERLKANGVVVLPVSAASNYLSLNFVTVDKQVPDSLLNLLAGIREQLIWLKLDEMELTKAGYAAIGKLDNLTRLQITRGNLSDETIGTLSGLKNLQWLNIAGSNVSLEGYRQLSGLSNLKQLFLYKGGLTNNDWSALQQLFPKVQIDTGNYRLPLLPGDTSLVK